MRQSIAQELDYGCGVACFAFVCGITFQQAVDRLGREYSVKHGWRPKDIVDALRESGYQYKNKYVRKQAIAIYPVGTIVLLDRSAAYPVGHYLVLSERGWMDPWINIHISKNIALAQSGFRTHLPGRAMYALIPMGP